MKSLIINIIFMLSLNLLKADDAVITAKTKTTAESVYEKAVADNTKEAEKAYQAYIKALEDANAKVLKALESAKADLNDTKKFTKLTITERATAIEELDAKIKAVKAGAVGEVITTQSNLPKENKVDLTKVIVGKWNYTIGQKEYIIIADAATITNTVDGNTATYVVDGKTLTITWKNGIVHTLTQKKMEWVGTEGSKSLKMFK